MAINGLRSTWNFVGVTTTDGTNARTQRPENWREGLLLLYPNGKMPLTALTSQMKNREVDDSIFNWWEKEVDDRRVAITVALTASTSGTTITFAAGDGNKLKAGDVLYSEQSQELMRVTAIAAGGTTATVTRAFAGSTVAALTTTALYNPYLVVVGSAFEENSSAPTGVNFDPSLRTNYTQIFRNTLEISRTAAKTRLRTGDAVREAKRETLELHGIDMERAMWFGKKAMTTANSNPLHTMDGVIQQIGTSRVTTACTTAGDKLTMVEFENLMFEAFKYGSTEKMGFCGNRALLAINQMVRKNSTYNISMGVKEYGMNVSRLVTPFGELVLKTHPLFNQMGTVMSSTTAGEYAYTAADSWLFVMDMDNVKYVYLKDSDTKYEPVLQSNGVDGMKSGYLTECSIEVVHPKSHYLIKAVVTGGADA
jgi:hypothetical protein